MIGKSLRERNTLGALSVERAVRALTAVLPSLARPLVEVRAQNERMIACVFVSADKPSARLCKELGFELKPGATAVFGLLGEDASSVLPGLDDSRRAWLEAPCGARETKVFLVAAGGTALLSIESNGGKVAVTALP
jgi:hypothetical protein